ncbi:MAG: ribosome maturation factor RimP [Bacilli bacterium]|nr:ribosome maturation factor RimP [Bacillales bacterium]MDY2575380.1 ribosome maturation factor RimP [Bacilli bacterium]
MSELLEKVKSYIEPLVNQRGLYLDKFSYEKRGKDYYLVIYVEKEDDVITLDEICEVSEIISNKLDEIDLINDNYILDVSTSGAEKPIKDFSKFDKYIGKYITVKLKNPVEGNNSYTGTLEEASEEKIKMSYKVKTRTKYVEILKSNITKANLAVKF